MYKGRKFYQDSKFWKLIGMVALFIVIILIEYLGIFSWADWLRGIWN